MIESRDRSSFILLSVWIFLSVINAVLLAPTLPFAGYNLAGIVGIGYRSDSFLFVFGSVPVALAGMLMGVVAASIAHRLQNTPHPKIRMISMAAFMVQSILTAGAIYGLTLSFFLPVYLICGTSIILWIVGFILPPVVLYALQRVTVES